MGQDWRGEGEAQLAAAELSRELISFHGNPLKFLGEERGNGDKNMPCSSCEENYLHTMTDTNDLYRAQLGRHADLSFQSN